MATYLQNLTIARDSIAEELAEVIADNLRPDYTVGGRTFSWQQHRDSLVRNLDDLNLLIIKATGPQERSVLGLS